MQEQINLTIPNGWNQCTTSQLEQIALIMIEQIEKAKADRYHPFDMQNVKIAVFFLFTGLKVDVYPDPRMPINEQQRTFSAGSNELFDVFLSYNINDKDVVKGI